MSINPMIIKECIEEARADRCTELAGPHYRGDDVEDDTEKVIRLERSTEDIEAEIDELIAELKEMGFG